MKMMLSVVSIQSIVCWLLASAFTMPAPAYASSKAQLSCGDFLAQLHKKPIHLIYDGCVPLLDQQGKPLRATYHVGGQFAEITEESLASSVGLNRLSRSCCQWDAPTRAFTDKKGRVYTIWMVSDETTINDRAQWSQVGRFEVIVELLTEGI